MATSIVFTDDTGAVTLTNGLPVPGDRFADWGPDVIPVQSVAFGLGDGDRHSFAFRTDQTASLALTNMPNTKQSDALRLKAHLETGGSCTVNTGDTGARSYTCKLAEGGSVEFRQTDKSMLEYTLTITGLRNTAGTAMLCIY